MNVLLFHMAKLNYILDEILNLIVFFVKVLFQYFDAAIPPVNILIQTIIMILELFQLDLVISIIVSQFLNENFSFPNFIINFFYSMLFFISSTDEAS
jgi:hypothetical protein